MNEGGLMKMSEKQFIKYRKKPIIVEAYQADEEISIETLEGTMKAEKGDYIIRGIKGELYPCREDIFYETYEKMEKPYVDYCDMKIDLKFLQSHIESNIRNYFTRHGIYELSDITINESPLIDDLSIKMNPLVEDKFLDIIDDFEEEFGLKKVRITRFERIATNGEISEISERNVTYSFKAK